MQRSNVLAMAERAINDPLAADEKVATVNTNKSNLNNTQRRYNSNQEMRVRRISTATEYEMTSVS
jgi:hypothetical protein